MKFFGHSYRVPFNFTWVDIKKMTLVWDSWGWGLLEEPAMGLDIVSLTLDQQESSLPFTVSLFLEAKVWVHGMHVGTRMSLLMAPLSKQNYKISSYRNRWMYNFRYNLLINIYSYEVIVHILMCLVHESVTLSMSMYVYTVL